MTVRRLHAAVLCASLVVGFLGVPRTALAEVASPTVTGPIGDAGIRGYPLWDSWFDLGELGYEEAEYFVSGTAQSISADRPSASYTTRIIVTRPKDRKAFNGTVLLDWVNVTAQFENAVDIVEAHEFLLRRGYAFVHVSAQAAGICCTPLTPKVWDPVRYEALSHPGDEYSFDIFSQVTKALKFPVGIDPLDGLQGSRRIIAAGQSQSAIRLSTYVRQVQPRARVVDAFLIHGGGSKVYDSPPVVPVLHLLSDAEASPTAPNQTENYRLWEIAGTAHSDFWIGYHQEFGQGPRFFGASKRSASADEEMHAVAGNYGEQPHPMHATCIFAGASFPMRHSLSAALHHLNRWVATGDAPPAGPRFEFNGAMLARDEHGNALGGIRLPPIDVPVARYASTSCGLGGITIPFTDVELRALYPSPADYYSRIADATKASVDAGFLLRADATDLLKRACAAKARWQDASGSGCVESSR